MFDKKSGDIKKADDNVGDASLINKIEDSQTKGMPVFGCAKGMFIMMPNFDEPLEEFEEYM